MLLYTFDQTLDGLMTAVFDAYALRQRPEGLVADGTESAYLSRQATLWSSPDEVYRVVTAADKAARVWAGLEKRLPAAAMRVITVSWLSELSELSFPLFNYIYKVFSVPASAAGQWAQGLQTAAAPTLAENFTDPDVLFVRNVCRRVMHEQLRMKQFLRFQKAKDGTYLGVVAPDHNVLPLIIDHFQERFADQPWLIYDARRRYGYYYATADGGPGEPAPLRITFEEGAPLPFDLETGQLDEALLSEGDHLYQDLWRTYFKAICIRERMNPRKQLNDMPRRYWKYMTEKQ